MKKAKQRASQYLVWCKRLELTGYIVLTIVAILVLWRW